MSLLTELLGVDKLIENQNRRIFLLGQEIDTLRGEFELLLEEHRQVGVDPEGGVGWLNRPAAVKVLHKQESG